MLSEATVLYHKVGAGSESQIRPEKKVVSDRLCNAVCTKKEGNFTTSNSRIPRWKSRKYTANFSRFETKTLLEKRNHKKIMLINTMKYNCSSIQYIFLADWYKLQCYTIGTYDKNFKQTANHKTIVTVQIVHDTISNWLDLQNKNISEIPRMLNVQEVRSFLWYIWR